MNGRELAEKLHTSTKTVHILLASGTIKAEKKKRVWDVDIESYLNFLKRNEDAVEKLKAEFMDLYWRGLTVEQLQGRTKTEFQKRGIVFPAPGFAERTIYESLMRDKAAGG